MTFQYLLRSSKKDKRAITLIAYSKHFKNRRLQMSTGIIVSPGDWKPDPDPEKATQGFGKLKGATRLVEHSQELEKLERVIKETLKDFNLSGGVTDNKTFIKRVRGSLGQEKASSNEKGITVLGFMRDRYEVKKASGALVKTTLGNHKQAINHLEAFEAERGLIFFKDLQLQFYEEYYEFLQQRLNENSTGKIIRTTKVYLNEARDYGHQIPSDLKKWKTIKQKGLALYFDKDQLVKINELELSNERLKKARDMFIFLCYTGLRHSDAVSITTGNIKETKKGIKYLELLQKKTRSPVKIPLNQYSEKILENYDGIPHRTSSQKLNKALGEIRSILLEKYKEREFSRNVNGKYHLIPFVSHTGRRSFASNFYKANPNAIADIMRITGHSHEQNFRTYIGADDEGDLNRSISAMEVAMENMNY